MKPWLALVALAAASPASATSGVPLGRFGDWELWSAPPGVPPADRPMPPMRYSARFAEQGWNRSWPAESNIMFGPEGALVTTYGGDCILRERVTGGRSRQAAVLMEVLLRQSRYVEPCASAPGDPLLFQRRMRGSMPDLRRMLDRLLEAREGRAADSRPKLRGER